MEKKIFIKTFGCQMNEYDSLRIKDFVKTIGYTETKNVKDSDCYIINTCHIREKATEKVFHDVGRVKKEFRNKKKPILIIAGCVAQAEGDLILKQDNYIDAVIGPQSYHKIKDIISKIEKKNTKIDYTEFETIKKFDEINNIRNLNNDVSSFITIQEGCDKFCKFCVVPYTRGPELSRSFSEIKKEAMEIVSNGVKEITLLGQNVNAYKNNKKKISDLIYELNEIQNLERVRYTTSHPKDMKADLIKAHKDCNKLMPVLHLPVQSGSNNILKEMNRKHTKEDYLDIIYDLKKNKKNIKFTSDFIIAYPGETEKDFDLTLELMEQVEFIGSYSFIYSPRPGTPAAKLEPINKEVAKKRLIKFQSVANKIKIKYRSLLKNTSVKVLFERKINNQNKYFGRDEHFNSVIVESNQNLVGKIKFVLIKEINLNTLFGEVDFSKNLNYAAA